MKPTNRREMFLAKMAGENVVCPEPANREEMYMAKMAEGGSGGGVAVYTMNNDSTALVDVENETLIAEAMSGKVVFLHNKNHACYLLSGAGYDHEWEANFARFGAMECAGNPRAITVWGRGRNNAIIPE